MTDARLRAGDVAIDLIKRGKVMVLERAAISVREHRQTADYDIGDYGGNPLLDVTDEETVWTCVYLPDEPTTEFSGTYDFPESRLARVPVEEANQDLRRPQEAQALSMLEAMFTAAMESRFETATDDLEFIARQALPDDLVDEARELADVEQTVAAGGDD